MKCVTVSIYSHSFTKASSGPGPMWGDARDPDVSQNPAVPSGNLQSAEEPDSTVSELQGRSPGVVGTQALACLWIRKCLPRPPADQESRAWLEPSHLVRTADTTQAKVSRAVAGEEPGPGTEWAGGR